MWKQDPKLNQFRPLLAYTKILVVLYVSAAKSEPGCIHHAFFPIHVGKKAYRTSSEHGVSIYAHVGQNGEYECVHPHSSREETWRGSDQAEKIGIRFYREMEAAALYHELILSARGQDIARHWGGCLDLGSTSLHHGLQLSCFVLVDQCLPTRCALSAWLTAESTVVSNKMHSNKPTRLAGREREM